jgi:hypothetical protein
MASVVLSGDTSGTITVSAPAVSGSNTQTLVAATGTLAPLISGTAVASTSGTSIEFTGIPSWVKRITVMFQGVSTSGTNFLIVQLGTGASPTYTTSGYLGASNANNSVVNQTTGLPVVGLPTAANVCHGSMTITNISGNSWCSAASISMSNTAANGGGAGSIALAAQLTALRITTVGTTDTFDAGSINILYE